MKSIHLVRTVFQSNQVPLPFDGYRIALVGNLFVARRKQAEVQDLLLGEKADLLMLGGNVKPSHASPNAEAHAALAQFLRPLQFPDGILAVRGYHDRKHFWEELPDSSPVRLLSNSTHTIQRQGEALVFAGLQTAHACHLDRGQNQLRESLSDIPTQGMRILLGQSGDLLRIAQGHPLDLILAVDNLHYGIRIPGVGVLRRDSKVPLSWTMGWLEEGGIPLYLSPGVGTYYHPFRFLLRREVTVITLRALPQQCRVRRPMSLDSLSLSIYTSPIRS